MSVTTLPPRVASRRTVPPSPPPTGGRGGGSAWPRTSRLLPWSIALFLGMLWLVPFDGMELPVDVGIDARLDRFLLGGMALLLGLVLATSGRVVPRRRPTPMSLALVAWLLAVVASLAANLVMLSQTGELSLGVRVASIAFSFALLYAIAVSVIRREEVRPLLDLSLGLACVMALGLVYQYRTGTNPFTLIFGYIPGISIDPPPLQRTGARPQVVGPTGHGLAACTILGMMLPYALVRIGMSTERRTQVIYGIAAILLVAGAVATIRKTAIVVPVAAVITVAAYRPRLAVRLMPVGIVCIFAVQAIAPSALSGIRYQFVTAGQQGTTQDRQADYGAVAPDLKVHPLLGRGYGTYDPLKYRYLDNQYLMLGLTTGLFGIVAYFGLIAAALLMAHRIARDGDPETSAIGVALVAALVGFAVSNALFDTLAFRHVPYLVVLFTAFAAVLRRPQPRRARARVRA